MHVRTVEGYTVLNFEVVSCSSFDGSIKRKRIRVSPKNCEFQLYDNQICLLPWPASFVVVRSSPPQSERAVYLKNSLT